jgi:16S rRNA (guanine966-N2)-methyltransferase
MRGTRGTRNGVLRIIGGRWRGRRIAVPDQPGLRPTPDRVRETLFNWLQPVIVDARCLDLFAGSGALAIEALSRGAAEVVAVEQNPLVADGLREMADKLGASGLEIMRDDARAYLERVPRPFDVVFIDPPFGSTLLSRMLWLLEPGWLASPAWIYLECAPGQDEEPLPEAWEILRHKRAGEVIYRLARRA